MLGILALDLGVFHRKGRLITIREALIWTGFWIVTALAFTVGVYYLYENRWLGIGSEIGHELTGRQAALQFLTGYLLEKSLSLDNIFVIALIFGYFRVPLVLQHRVLFWGIFGAIVMRGLMIVGILSVGIIASIIAGQRDTAALVSPIVDELDQLSRLTVRRAKKLAALVMGGGLLAAGVVMLVLPGPGSLVIFAGLTVLATHFVWARRLLTIAKRETRSLMERGRRLFNKQDQ